MKKEGRGRGMKKGWEVLGGWMKGKREGFEGRGRVLKDDWKGMKKDWKILEVG